MMESESLIGLLQAARRPQPRTLVSPRPRPTTTQEQLDALVTLLDEACAIALEELDQEPVHHAPGRVANATSRSFPHQ